MAQRKSNEVNLLEHLAKKYDEVKALPVIDERWYVVEVTPRRCVDRHWDSWEEQKIRIASPYFDVEEKLDRWLEKYEPDTGNTFSRRHEYLREFTERRWSSV